MRVRILLPLILVLLTIWLPGFSQSTAPEASPAGDLYSARIEAQTAQDTSGKREIRLSRYQALKFLEKSCSPFLWKDAGDPLRSALNQLIFEASNPHHDSIELFLQEYPYDSLDIPLNDFYIWKRVRIRPEDVGADPVVKEITGVIVGPDTAEVAASGQNPAAGQEMKDSIVMVITDTLTAVSSIRKSYPFRYCKYPNQSDSIKAAVNALIDYIRGRDSSVISIAGIDGRRTPVWLNSRSDMTVRYWLKNDLNDSVTVWVGNPERNAIGLYLEHGVSFRRPGMQGYYSGASVNVEEPDKSKLLDIRKIVTKTQNWKYRTESIFSLNQGMLSNWVKGGESSVAASLDLTTFFDYSNKPRLISSSHFARLKFGMITSEEDGHMKIMKNLDLLETNSKFNHKAFGKFDFSAIMLFKTQIATGKTYEKDTSYIVTKFFNPAVITLGFGLDYKPNKLTSINFSPLSYKATFVPDTALIDQTKYGVAADRRSKHEPGASFLISNEFHPVKSIVMTNRLQLFTNYINNPLNIDVDWEMILVAHLNWFTDVRLNTHLIFDDDTRTLLFDRKDNPIMDIDGLQKKTARVQFKEMLGLSFVFRF